MAGKSAKVLRAHIIRKSTFATALPVAGSSAYTHVPVLEGLTYNIEQKRDAGQEARDDGLSSEETNTTKHATASFSTKIHNGATAGFGGALVAPEKFYNQQLLESAFGTAAGSFAGTTVAAPGTALGNTGPIVVASATGADIGAGLIFQGTSSVPEMRIVTLISGSNVTLDRDLTVAANYATSANIYGGWVLSATLGEYVKQLELLIKKDGENLLLDNGQVTKCEIDGSAGDGMRMNFDMEFSTWNRSGFNPTTHTDHKSVFTGTPLVAKLAVATINGVEYCLASMKIDLGIKKEPIACSSGADGIQGMAITSVEPSGSFTPYFSTVLQGLDDNATGVPVTLWITNANIAAASSGAAAAAGGIALYMPNCQIRAPEATQNGQRAHSITFQARGPTVAQIANGITKACYLTVFGGAATVLATDL